MKRFSWILLFWPCMLLAHDIPKVDIPEDQLLYFGLNGHVAEVCQDDWRHYNRIIWRFDIYGRLTEYLRYGSPFAGDGGCVFRLIAHYQYSYTESGEINYDNIYDENYALIDEYADQIIPLFPEKEGKDTLCRLAKREYGDSTSCWSQNVHPEGQQAPNYAGIRYDRFGNWIEWVYAAEMDEQKANISTRTIRYYAECELMGLRVGVREVRHHVKEDGADWNNVYFFSPKGQLMAFDSYRNREHLYDWHVGCTDVESTDLMVAEINDNTTQEITYWGNVNEECFAMVVDYVDDAYECMVWPMHNGYWMAVNHWSISEEEGRKGVLADVDAFVTADTTAGFLTRNYGGTPLPVYASADGKKIKRTIRYECQGKALDANPQTRRIRCVLTPLEEDIKAEPVIGWIDEEWVCANTLTTCP